MKLSINGRLVFTILSLAGVILSFTMLAGFICAIAFREPGMERIFLALMLIFGLGGFAMFKFSRRGLTTQTIKIREGILAVALCWIFASALGALPYLLAGSHHSFIDAFFESSACITTTGSTLIDNLAELPKSLLLWRQLMTWLGGLGIVIFAITIIPMLGFGAANLASAETPLQTLDNIRTRVSDTARTIVFLFVSLTVAEIVLLGIGGMGFYDAIVLSFSSIGNGGFATYRTGAIVGGGIYAEAVIGVFCVLASMSFVSLRLLLKRRVRDFFKEIEIRLYLIMLGVVCALVVIILVASGTYDTAGEALRYGVFQTVSFATTAGYAGADYDIWPQAIYWLLIFVMVIGGCSGSTSGGIKVVRAAVAVALIRRNMYKRLHPNAVVAVKIGDKAVSADRVSSISSFMMIYALIVLLSCFVLSFENLDTKSTLGTVIAMLSNTGLVVGPGIGFGESFGVFSQFSRLFMSFLMIAGRLELLTMLLLFSPAFWRADR